MMRPLLHATALAVFGLPLPGHAEEDVPAATVTVASRTFLVGEAPGATNYVEDFLPLTEMRWLWRLIQDDPVLDGAVVHVKQRPSPPAYLLSAERMEAQGYTNTERAPDSLRVEGFVTRTYDGEGEPAQFLIRPDVPEPDFQMTCGSGAPFTPADEFNICTLLATYPLDPAISVEARLYHPPHLSDLAPRLPAIVARLREITLCLDVTDNPPADPQAALDALLAANPRLESCENKLSS